MMDDQDSCMPFDACPTESKICDWHSYAPFVARTFDHTEPKNISLPHAALGLAGEAGEVADIVKKYTRGYGYLTKLLEEMGDVLFYLQALCNIEGITLEDVRDANVAKLKARFPDGKFTPEAAKADRGPIPYDKSPPRNLHLPIPENPANALLVCILSAPHLTVGKPYPAWYNPKTNSYLYINDRFDMVEADQQYFEATYYGEE